MDCLINQRFFSIAVLIGGLILVPFRTVNAKPAGDAQNGKKVFEKLGCFRCHGTAGEGMPQKGSEAGVPQIAATRIPLQGFIRSIRAPKGQMPPFSSTQASDSELSDIYAFLHSLGSASKLELPPSANDKNGQHFYIAYGCYECHGLQGQGSSQTGGSRIGPQEIPFSSYVAYVRQPTGQMPPYTPKAISDAQLADIYVFLRSRPKAESSKNILLLN